MGQKRALVRILRYAPRPVEASCTFGILDMLGTTTAQKRAGSAADMYGAIRYLCSDDADFVTGQVLSPNGGFINSPI